MTNQSQRAQNAPRISKLARNHHIDYFQTVQENYAQQKQLTQNGFAKGGSTAKDFSSNVSSVGGVAGNVRRSSDSTGRTGVSEAAAASNLRPVPESPGRKQRSLEGQAKAAEDRA